MADKQGASSSRPLFTRKEAPSDARRCQSFGARPIPPPKSTILCSSMQPSNSPSLSRLGMGSSQIHAGARSALNRPTAPPVPPKPQLIPRKHKSTEEDTSPSILMENTKPCCQKPSQKTKSSHHGYNSAKTDQNVQNFMDACSVIYELIKQVRHEHGDCVVSATLWKTVRQTYRILKEKEICISVLGMHNCGKSTFLNAIIGDEFLPVLALSETSIKVKIQHDGGVHMGVCPHNCEEEKYACCPRLIVQFKDKRLPAIEIYGPHKICEYLQQKNKEIRSAQSTLSPELLTVTLKVNMPLLSERIPPGWTVSIIDNPGFGEANEHITQLAEASMVISSAYIYLMQTENVGGREAADFFRELKKIDEKAFTDGRLTIGITKYDINYGSSSRGNVTIKMVKERVAESIKRAVDAQVTVSDDMIIPLCGEWALISSKLGSCLIADPKKEEKILHKEAVDILRRCPEVSLPSGQGQNHTEAIMKIYSPIKVIQEIETHSGISDLEARIGCVGRACVKVWATKLHKTFQCTLNKLRESIENYEDQKHKLHQTKEKELNGSRSLLKDIYRKRRSIKTTIVRGRDRTSAQVWKSFERTYAKDIRESKPQEAGKDKARTLIIGFRDICRRKIEQKEFGPCEFEASLKEFLDESAKKLQMVFDSACGFWNSSRCLIEQIEHVIKEISSMKLFAVKLLDATSIADFSIEESDEVAGFSRVRRKRSVMREPPKLGDIKLKVSIPGVSLPWWKKIVQFFRGLLSRGEVEMSPTTHASPVENQSETSHSRNINSVVRPYQPVGSDGESDIYDDCTWHESSVIAKELDIDDVDRHRQPKPSVENIYRSWTIELEETLKKVQMYMEEACDKYFREIEYKAIKYFYQEYCLKTSDLLNEFDAEFEDSLRKEKERQGQLEEETDGLYEELKELKVTKERLGQLEKQLIEKYGSFTIKHCDVLTECQPLQEKSYHDYFKLAKERDKGMRSVVHAITEFDAL